MCRPALFQLHYERWRWMLKYFWMSVVVYTMLVLILVYTFQFESSINVWSNMTGMSREKYAFKTSSDICMSGVTGVVV